MRRRFGAVAAVRLVAVQIRAVEPIYEGARFVNRKSDMSDPFELERFVAAQEPVIDRVCGELRAGRKRSHWMWFVFPQIRGLGSSPMAQHYAISSLAEAKAYLDHPVLGPRLRECTGLVIAIEGRSIDAIFGHPDDLKFRSSMTLFARAAPDDTIFAEAIAKYFPAGLDPQTLDRL
jgi:uncharacterized protein (DUF1810 family)